MVAGSPLKFSRQSFVEETRRTLVGWPKPPENFKRQRTIRRKLKKTSSRWREGGERGRERERERERECVCVCV